MLNNKIAILIDSCADVPKEYLAPNVYVLPVRILYKDREYFDRVDISPDDVYARMPGEIPTTSLPSPENVSEILDKIVADGYDTVLSISISSNLSGTFNMLRLVANEEKRVKMHVIDTKNIGIGCGAQAIYAMQLVEEGRDITYIINKVNESVSKTKIFFSLATLEYLAKGGRIGRVAAALGSLLKIKPIITCNEEGTYSIASKIRGRSNSLEECVNLATNYAKQFDKCEVMVANGAAKNEAKIVIEKVKQTILNALHVMETELSPALGVHTGPGLVGICIRPIL